MSNLVQIWNKINEPWNPVIEGMFYGVAIVIILNNPWVQQATQVVQETIQDRSETIIVPLQNNLRPHRTIA